MIWDLRMGPRKMNEMQLYTIPAHQSLVSRVKYAADDGALLMTASYDKKVKLWSGKTFGLVNCLEGHEGRVMGADILPATQQIVSVAYDRTIKIWKMKGEVTPEEQQQAEPMEE
jgi:U4/U6 small nuclear ribonucleoprotein PRP4